MASNNDFISICVAHMFISYPFCFLRSGLYNREVLSIYSVILAHMLLRSWRNPKLGYSFWRMM